MNPDDGGRYLERVLEGDVDAFRFIVRQNQQMAFSIAISMVKEQSDADDVVQNAFIRAYKSIRSFRGDAKFSSWLYKIVVNESLKYIKKNQRQREYVNLVSTPIEVAGSLNNAVSNIHSEETKKAIKKALKAMKPKEALVLKFHYLHEQSIAEIHEATGFSVSNIKVLLYRARKNFMGIYLEQEVEYER